MNDILIIYPHGLGDCILLTPTLRELSKTHEIGVVIQKRFESSEIYHNCPYITDIYYDKDPWNDFPNSKIGFEEVIKEGNLLGQNKGYDKTVFINNSGGNKVPKNAEAVGITLTEFALETFSTNEDKEFAKNYVENLFKGEPFGFVHSNTGLREKDLPENYGSDWIKWRKKIKNIVEVGQTFKYDDFNINIQIEIMKLSSAICIPDSVFFHAAIANNKEIDFAFFGRGPWAYDCVGPLYNQHLIKKLEYKL